MKRSHPNLNQPLLYKQGAAPPQGQNIQQLEAALRELLERQTRDAEVAAEAMKRVEAMAAKQQAFLEGAEKRDQELKEKLRNRHTYSDDDEVVADSRSRTWKPASEREQQTSLLTRHPLGRAPQEIQVSHGYGAI
ncbi:hypothetical protein PIB30_026605 [Stylosanthes scabra]|uniref:Uncharacterized protein n=1 Tax=Stylosanthes scabra TaxID=79078 RepID=A0ABU6VDI6_9FABA|nr:hypothetical protein [Stylosanthes scabra]